MRNTILIITLFIAFQSYGQESVAPEKYWIEFTDKNDSEYSISKPENFLSKRAIERRRRFNIAVVENDLPVNALYVDSLQKLGLKVLNCSKWFNAVTVQSTDTALLDTLYRISFIADKFSLENKILIDETIKIPDNYGTFVTKQIIEPQLKLSSQLLVDLVYDYGNSANQVALHNGHIMHKEGFTGKGVIFAVFDAGFYKIDQLPAFDSIVLNNQIIGTRDFVDDDTIVYNADYHGMKVLSTIASNMPGKLIGTAPKSKFWLIRTEDSKTENIIEEGNWIAAAEFADSAGVDIITSSLGYTNFDNDTPKRNYSCMTGNAARVSKGADIAASKGLLIVTSAGNSGDDTWHYISAPADADSVLTVGAVNSIGGYAYFSSTGPTFDGRVKPNVVAKGFSASTQSVYGSVSGAYGTSFSAPIMAGMVACLWQAQPELSNMEIIKAIEKSSTQYCMPDSLLGYGVPDILLASLFPNGFHFNDDNFNSHKNTGVQSISVKNNLKSESLNNSKFEVFDVVGKIIYSGKLKFYDAINEKIKCQKLNQLPKGIYNIKVTRSRGNVYIIRLIV